MGVGVGGGKKARGGRGEKVGERWEGLVIHLSTVSSQEEKTVLYLLPKNVINIQIKETLTETHTAARRRVSTIF